MSTCMIQTNNVTRHHSEDIVEVFHGTVEPAIGCGFHATYYRAELIQAHNKKASTS